MRRHRRGPRKDLSGRDIEDLDDLGNELISDSEVASGLNSFFCGVADSLDRRLPVSDHNPSAYYSNACSNSIFFPPISNFECINLISQLKITKNSIKEIPVKIFIALKEVLSYPLTKMINLSLQTGIFPDSLKVARLTPIFKSGDMTDPANYRPIASLPFISKLFERYVANCLTSFLKSNGIL